MKKISTFLFTLFVVWFTLTGYTQKSENRDSTEIIILHTNDMHAKIDNLGKLAYLADSLKRTHLYVFLVAAGDNFTGNPIVDQVEDKGYPMIDLMNRCGFNASAIGNHEFDLGQDFLTRRMDQAKFPFLCANLEVTTGKLKQPQPYTILKAGKTNIAVVSFIELNDKGIPDSHPSKLQGIKFTNGISKSNELTFLKEKCSVLVALTHLGVDSDIVLAKKQPQFDLIIGGHSHTVIDTLLMINHVLITQAGCYLKYVGKTTLKIDEGKITDKRDELIPIGQLKKSDPAIKDMIDKYNNNEEFKKVVAVAAQPVDGFDNLGSLFTDALVDQFNVNFAFQNRKGLRVYSLSQGDITLKEIYQLDPFQNQTVTYTLSYDEISSLICYAYNIEKHIDLAVSGMKYTVVTDATGRCASVEMTDNSGHPLNTSTTYTVAMNDYISSSYIFQHKETGIQTGITTEHVLINYLQKLKTVNYSGIERTFVKTGK